jgi:hypothetical protein
MIADCRRNWSNRISDKSPYSYSEESEVLEFSDYVSESCNEEEVCDISEDSITIVDRKINRKRGNLEED